MSLRRFILAIIATAIISYVLGSIVHHALTVHYRQMQDYERIILIHV